ncbi:MAG TPA: hypothetical protein VE544_07395 [Nitrososphaeraceae archaeon]|nr:hypothetical protein [Nitrososphaeraceae archaeon]
MRKKCKETVITKDILGIIAMISKSVVLVLALVGFALPTAVGGGEVGMLQLAAAAAAAAAEEESSLEEILGSAFDLADLDETEDGGVGMGMQIFVSPNIPVLDDDEEEEEGAEDNRIICIEVEPGLIECFEV